MASEDIQAFMDKNGSMILVDRKHAIDTHDLSREGANADEEKREVRNQGKRSGDGRTPRVSERRIFGTDNS